MPGVADDLAKRWLAYPLNPAIQALRRSTVQGDDLSPKRHAELLGGADTYEGALDVRGIA